MAAYCSTNTPYAGRTSASFDNTRRFQVIVEIAPSAASFTPTLEIMSIRSVPYVLASAAVLLSACSSSADTETPVGDSASVVLETGEPSSWRVTTVGMGPLLAGQTLAEANAAAGITLTLPNGASPECSYAEWPTAPAGVRVMVVQDTVVRVDVTQPGIETIEGGAIGDNEGKINSLYATRISMRPHKYTTGKYMIATNPGRTDTLHSIVFETDGAKVLQFRSGRLPEVEWVEGCS